MKTTSRQITVGCHNTCYCKSICTTSSIKYDTEHLKQVFRCVWPAALNQASVQIECNACHKRGMFWHSWVCNNLAEHTAKRCREEDRMGATMTLVQYVSSGPAYAMGYTKHMLQSKCMCSGTRVYLTLWPIHMAQRPNLKADACGRKLISQLVHLCTPSVSKY